MNEVKNVDDYIFQFPEEIQIKLTKIRNLIKDLAPNAKEIISYKMPTYKLKRNLVHFAAQKNHIGFYPTPSAITAFKEELTKYKTSKGAIQFPLDQELPLNLIKEIVKFRIQEENKM